jgi:hypothetical protein
LERDSGAVEEVAFSLCEGPKRGEERSPDEYCATCGGTMSTHFTLDLGDAPLRSRAEEEDTEVW